MSFELTLSLDVATIAPFRAALTSLRDELKPSQLETLACDARAHLNTVIDTDTGPTLRERLMPIDGVAEMLTDPGWSLSPDGLASLVGALRYFVDPEGLIPDDKPVFGLLDDAIVLELALGDARHDWLAWQDFCAFRNRHGAVAAADRDTWMQTRETMLRQQIRQSRKNTYGAPLAMEGHSGRNGSYVRNEVLDTVFRVY